MAATYLYVFLDFSKAFDRVNYWKLFSQMLEEGSDVCVVRLLVLKSDALGGLARLLFREIYDW